MKLAEVYRKRTQAALSSRNEDWEREKKWGKESLDDLMHRIMRSIDRTSGHGSLKDSIYIINTTDLDILSHYQFLLEDVASKLTSDGFKIEVVGTIEDKMHWIYLKVSWE